MSEPDQRALWIGPAGTPAAATAFGLRLAGGGAHQSKTMMFDELDLLLSTGLRAPTELAHAAIVDNILGKSTKNSRTLTYRHMVSLYGLNAQPGCCQTNSNSVSTGPVRLPFISRRDRATRLERRFG